MSAILRRWSSSAAVVAIVALFVATAALLVATPAAHAAGQAPEAAAPSRTAGTESTAAATAEGAEYRAVLDRYCTTCHNDRLQTAGLTLESLDMVHVGEGAETWEKVIRKLRAR